MRLPVRSLPSFRRAGPSIQEIKAHQWPMGPPSPGTDPATYWTNLARDQWSEFSVAQRLNAWRAGKSLDLLSAEVRRGLLAHRASPVNAVLLVHAPSVKRAASVALGKFERGVGSVSRRLSTRRKPVLRNSPLQAALHKPAAPLKAFSSQNSMVPSIFAVHEERQPGRRVHFEEIPKTSTAQGQAAMQRRATAPTDTRPARAGAPALRPARTLPSGTDIRPPKNTKPVRKEDTGIIFINLDPALLPLTTNTPIKMAPAPRPAAIRFAQAPAPFKAIAKAPADLGRTTSEPQTSTHAPTPHRQTADVGRSKSLTLVDLTPVEPQANRRRMPAQALTLAPAPAPKPFSKTTPSRDEIANQIISRFYVSLKGT